MEKSTTMKRRFAGGMIALMLLGLTWAPTPASAVTTTELQSKIQSLLAQIATLQAQLNGTAPVTACFSFTSDLTIGQSGEAVRQLQSFLIGKGYTIPAGATGYFGGQTQQALARFQAAQFISPAVGYFGPLTRAKVQSLCTPVTPPVTNPGNGNTDPDTTEPNRPVLKGEATLDRFDVKNGDHTDLEEGDSNREIIELEFRVRDGDLRLNRIDLGFTPDVGNDEKDPWDVFDTISIWDGTTRIAQVDASRERNWREDAPNNGDYLLRLSNVNQVIESDTTVEYVVKASMQRSIRGTANGEMWNAFIPNDGIRGVDADNVAVSIGNTADYVTLNIDRAGSTDELLVRRSSDDPNASSLQVRDDGRSGYLTVFAFDLDTDDSRNDIEIRSLPVTLTVGSSTADTFVRDVRLVVDGKNYTRNSVTDGSTATYDFEFNRNDLVIEAGDRVTVSLEVDFKSLPSQYEGVTIVGGVDSSTIDARGSDRLTTSQLKSIATGETHALYSRGLSPTPNTFTATVTSIDGDANDYVTFVAPLRVTAFNQDVYIPIGSAGIDYRLTDSIGNLISTSSIAVVDSTGRERGSYLFIPEGSSETITLTVTYAPGITNTTVRLEVLGINFSDAQQPATQTWNAVPQNDYRSPVRVIVN